MREYRTEEIKKDFTDELKSDELTDLEKDKIKNNKNFISAKDAAEIMKDEHNGK